MRSLFLILTLVFCGAAVEAQHLDAPAFGRKSLSVQYENDLFGHTDYYYTQGLQLAYSHPALQKLFLAKAMLRLRDTVYSTGAGIEQDCYTPMSILSDTILRSDRPFAAGLMLNCHLSSGKGKAVLTSRLSLGIVGAAAGGYEMQRGIHENTGNIIPHGWQYQIRNDAIVNYEMACSYPFIKLRGAANYLVPELSVQGLATVNAGTYLDKLSIGLSIRAGLTNEHAKPDCWLSYEVRGAAIGYDATLQGGIFNRDSPYTIPAEQLTRATGQQKAGLVLRFGALQLEGSYTWLSREFEGGKNHAWGGLSAAAIF